MNARETYWHQDWLARFRIPYAALCQASPLALNSRPINHLPNAH